MAYARYDRFFARSTCSFMPFATPPRLPLLSPDSYPRFAAAEDTKRLQTRSGWASHGTARPVEPCERSRSPSVRLPRAHARAGTAQSPLPPCTGYQFHPTPTADRRSPWLSAALARGVIEVDAARRNRRRHEPERQQAAVRLAGAVWPQEQLRLEERGEQHDLELVVDRAEAAARIL